MVDIAKKVNITLLNQLYGELLTANQKEAVTMYYDMDMSLMEISEQYGISRQGVRDTLKRAEQQLVDYEHKLGLLRRRTEAVERLNALKGRSPSIDGEIDAIIGLLEE